MKAPFTPNHPEQVAYEQTCSMWLTDGTPDGGCLRCGDDNEPPNLREIWAAADKKEKDWREAGEEKLLQQMLDAREGLKSLGWRDGQYAPKDGTRFLSIEAGSTGVFPCYWMTNKHMAEGGGFWSEAHGDLWPAKPTLWKPMPSNVELTGAAPHGQQTKPQEIEK